ncbi:MAG: methyltransferase domain-containing protein [Methylococcales bacterium]|nr:methyltransferase domain-containing protein [Methylococcaceae bacterium]
MDKPSYINIACGDSYIEGWRNFDYSPRSELVQQANLLGRLPLADNEAQVVYSSHFLEHIPVKQVANFLAECFRITQSGGRLRLVLPDLEELCRNYLQYRDQGQHDQADFLLMEMLDQCVRIQAGGELEVFYNQLLNTDSNTDMVEFVKHRTGHTVAPLAPPSGSRLQRFLQNPAKLITKLEQLYIKSILILLPSAFVQQNVSLATVGERHAWNYDFHTVQKLLQKAGFAEVYKVTASSSAIPDFPFHPLDVDVDGKPRKGIGSMYIEALKP